MTGKATAARERLTNGEYMAVSLLLQMTRENGGIPPSVGDVAAVLDVDRTTVSRRFRAAFDKGWIRPVAGKWALEVDVPEGEL